MCHGNRKEDEKSRISSRNISVVSVHHARHLVPNVKIGTPNRALSPILSFVSAILLIKACCPRDHLSPFVDTVLHAII